MLTAVVLAAIAAVFAAVIFKLAKQPFRSVCARAGKWAYLIRQLPRLNQATENIAWWIAWDEAANEGSPEDHQQAVQGIHDYLTAQPGIDIGKLRCRTRIF